MFLRRITDHLVVDHYRKSLYMASFNILTQWFGLPRAVLEQANFMSGWDQNDKEICLEINQTTAEFCEKFVADHPDMNNMQLSQMLLLQAGRFLMKPKKISNVISGTIPLKSKKVTEIKLSEDDLIVLPQEAQ